MISERFGEILASYQTKYIRNFIRPWTPDAQLTLTKIPDTTVTCRTCRGTKIISSVSATTGLTNTTVCPACMGHGTMQSQLADGSWRGD